MADDLQRLARDFLHEALRVSGMTPYALAKRAQVASTTITRPLNDPDYKFVPKGATLAKIATAAGMKLPDALGSSPSEPTNELRRIPVKGEVQAGALRRIPDDPTVNEWLDIHIPEYDAAALFAVRVVGRSMDLHYPDGTYVIAIPPAEAGLVDGDHVVVRIWDGDRAETTLKEIEAVEGNKLRLWPRSTDPAYQEPIEIELDRTENNQHGPEIIGVVVADYRRRHRGRAIRSIR